MWSFIKVPNVPDQDPEGVVSLAKYLVAEGDEVRKDQKLAIGIAGNVRFAFVSNYDGRILKLILFEGNLVAYGDPIATLQLTSDPIDGLSIARCEVLSD